MPRRRPQLITQKVFQQKMERDMAFERKRDELVAMQRRGQDLKVASLGEQRAQNMRRRKEEALYNNEILRKQHYAHNAKQERIRVRNIQQDSSLADALAVEHAKKERWEAEIARICESDPSLRELQSSINGAYLNQQRALQIEEKVFLKEIEKQREADVNAARKQHAMEEERKLQEEALRQRGLRIKERETLQQQIAERKRIIEMEGKAQFMKDKQMVDDLVRSLQEKDRVAFEKKMKKQAETKKFIDDFMVLQQHIKEKKKQEEREELEKIAKYAAEKDAREQGLAEKKAAIRAEEDRIYKRNEEQMKKKLADIERLEQMRELLWEEEAEQRRQQQDDERANKVVRMRNEMIEANEKQKEYKKLLLEEERKRDLELKNKILKDFDKRQREIDAQEAAKLDAKKTYIRAIGEQRAEKKRMMDALEAAEEEKRKVALEREEFRKRVVAEARMRILQAHAPALKGFLPKGAFKSKEEFDLVARAKK
eukprot:g3047.t1